MNEAPSTEIIFIGTIHSGHFEAKHYTAQAVKDILLALKPDAICVEACTKHLNPDGTLRKEVLEDCRDTPEVYAANEAAMGLGIRQIPFEHEGRDEIYTETNYFERERKAMEATDKWGDWLQANRRDSNDYRLTYALASACESQGQLNARATPDIVNSRGYDAVVWIKHNLIHHVIPEVMRDYPEMHESAEFLRLTGWVWDERNRIMAENLMQVAADSRGGRLVVVTGAEHRYILRELLSEKPGIVLREYWEVLGDG